MTDPAVIAAEQDPEARFEWDDAEPLEGNEAAWFLKRNGHIIAMIETDGTMVSLCTYDGADGGDYYVTGLPVDKPLTADSVKALAAFNEAIDVVR